MTDPLRYAGTYILDGHTPVPCEDISQWASWFEAADRRVAKDTIGKVSVSTVFLGVDHAFGANRPELFETLVFHGPLDGEMSRYSTWAEAEEGHKAMVEAVKNRPPVDSRPPMATRTWRTRLHAACKRFIRWLNTPQGF